MLNVVKLDRISQIDRGYESDLDMGGYFFSILRRWKFSRRLYQRATIGLTMTMRCTISYIGTSSFDLRQTFFEGDDEFDELSASQPLASFVYRVVRVDPITRKAAPLPEAAVSFLSSAFVADGEQFSAHVRPPMIPDRTYACRIRVRYDDMDYMFHTNVSSYLGFVMECAAQAAKNGFYTRLRGDVGFWLVRRVESMFLSESRAGDDVDVLTWEDECNKMLLNFAIKKANEMIYAAQVEYYDDPVVLRSKL